MNTDAWLKDRDIYLNNQVAASGEYKGIKVESTGRCFITAGSASRNGSIRRSNRIKKERFFAGSSG